MKNRYGNIIACVYKEPRSLVCVCARARVCHPYSSGLIYWPAVWLWITISCSNRVLLSADKSSFDLSNLLLYSSGCAAFSLVRNKPRRRAVHNTDAPLFFFPSRPSLQWWIFIFFLAHLFIHNCCLIAIRLFISLEAALCQRPSLEVPLNSPSYIHLSYLVRHHTATF